MGSSGCEAIYWQFFSYRPVSKNDTAMIRYVPQLGGNQKTRNTTQSQQVQEKRKTRSKAERAGIVVSGEETEGQQNIIKSETQR